MTVTCGKCKRRNDDDETFCRFCGAYLEWSSVPSNGADVATVEGNQGDGRASGRAQAATAVHAPPREPGPEYEPPPVRPEDERQQLPPTAGQLVCSKCGSGNWPHVRFCRRCGMVLERTAVAAPPSRLPGLLALGLVAVWIAVVVVVATLWLLYRPGRILGAAVLILGLLGLGVLVLRFKRAHPLERDPLPAGERKRKRNPFLGRDRMILLHSGLKMLAIFVIVAAACIGGLWAWNSAVQPQIVSFYASSREALFPRFRSVGPAAIFYTSPNTCVAGLSARPGSKGQKTTPTKSAMPNKFNPPRPRKKRGRKPCFPMSSRHSIADAFDKDLNTYWLSRTPRGTNDRIAVRFKPADIALFTIYAGDPTGEQVVAKDIQMTFYGPAQTVYYPPPFISPAPKKSNTLPSSREGRYWPVRAVREWTLLDSPAQQRFSTGDLKNIARVVITIRGSHPNTNPKATQALTEVEFWDKY